MQVPLTLWDISLWLAITAITLLITAQLVSSYHGQPDIYINKKRLKRTALAFGTLFMVTVAIRIMGIISS